MDFDTNEGKWDLILMLLYSDRLKRFKGEPPMSSVNFKMVLLAHNINIELFIDKLHLNGYVIFPDNQSAPLLTDEGSRFILDGGFTNKKRSKEEIQQIVSNPTIIIHGSNSGVINQSSDQSHINSTVNNNPKSQTSGLKQVWEWIALGATIIATIVGIYVAFFKK